MGEARHRAREPLSESARMAALGEKPFEAAGQALTGMVKSVYEKAGALDHQLLGLDFESGQLRTLTTLLVRHKEDVPHLLDKMLSVHPMVAHIFEAWSAPDVSCAPSQHKNRQDTVAIMMHIDGAMASIICLVDAKKRTVEPGPMIVPDRAEGNFARDVGRRQ